LKFVSSPSGSPGDEEQLKAQAEALQNFRTEYEKLLPKFQQPPS